MLIGGPLRSRYLESLFYMYVNKLHRLVSHFRYKKYVVYREAFSPVIMANMYADKSVIPECSVFSGKKFVCASPNRIIWCGETEAKLEVPLHSGDTSPVSWLSSE